MTPDSRLMRWIRVVFLLAVVVFAWLGLRGRFEEIGAAMGETSVFGIGGAVVLTVAGLVATGFVWLRVMSTLGASLPAQPGLGVFYVGQLGKYIPGSVWSIGAQADLARRHGAPPRATVAAGLVFLGYHVATGVILGSAILLIGALESPWPTWLNAFALAGASAGLAPQLVQTLSARIGGTSARVTGTDTLRILVLMTAAWSAYAAALILLAPDLTWDDLATVAAAFTIAYAVGVAVVVAPAGVGAREAVFVLLLNPVMGVAAATALALLARVVHTAADAALAALMWWRGVRRSSS